jgi:hypothetical protein
MNNFEATKYVCEMMRKFELPGNELLSECLLGSKDGVETSWDAAIIVSTGQAKAFYADMFQFWVRAFYFFTEDVEAGSMFMEVIPEVGCKSISNEEFQRDYFGLLRSRIQSPEFLEGQAFPGTYVELEKRSFSEAFTIIDSPNLKSGVARSNGEFVAYFVFGKGH